MNRILILALVIAVGTTSFAQAKPKVKNDPTYSVRNYKHSDKAAWAVKNNAEQVMTLDNTTVTDQSDAKHPLARKAKRKAVLSTFKGTTSPASSHKHPLGI